MSYEERLLLTNKNVVRKFDTQLNAVLKKYCSQFPTFSTTTKTLIKLNITFIV